MKAKILKISGLILLVFVLFVWSVPYLFSGKIAQMVRARVHKDLDAHVNFSGVDISLFRHFPQIAIALNDFQVIGVGEFDGDTLVSAKQLDLACGIGSLLSGDSVAIHSITADQPRVHALVLKNGHRNWKIMKSTAISADETETSARPIKTALEWYAIHNGYLYYQDERKDFVFELVNLEQEAAGDFREAKFALDTKSTVDEVHVAQHGTIPYQLSAKTSVNVALQVDRITHTYSFRTDQVKMNDLTLQTEGSFQWINDSSFNVNVKFKAPSTEFKNILSMLPAVYNKDFATLKSGGDVTFNGYINGRYDAKHNPAYHVNLEIANGFFQYPDLSMPMEKISLRFHVDNPDGAADHLTVNITKAHVEINKNALDFHLLIKDPKTKPYIDLSLQGKLDLANISKILKLDSGTKLSGLLDADLYAKGNVPGMEKKRKDQFQSGGQFNLSNFSYVSSAYPGGIILDDVLMNFNSKNVSVDELKGEYLATHFNASGNLNNLFAYALNNEALNASMKLKADDVNLNGWITSKESLKSSSSNQYRSAVSIPANIHFNIAAEVDKLHYDNLDLQNIAGNLVIADEGIQLNQVMAAALEGNMVINGSYSTKESNQNPEIAFTYDVTALDVQKTYFAFNTLQKIMPVAKFMSGKFNAHMTLKGRLGSDMVPDLHSLHGDGNLYLLEGRLKDFSPLDKLSQSLDLTALKDMPLKDIKADFSYSTEKVTVNPFIVQSNQLALEIAGIHGFDQTLDYDINLKVPRNQLGSKGKSFVRNVVEQAADKGIPIKLRDAVIMDAKMTGTINVPEVKADMNGEVANASNDLKKEVDDFVNAKLDSAKDQVNHPATAAKKPMIVQAAYKPKSKQKAKKSVVTSSKHKTVVNKAPKKKQKVKKYYSTSLKSGKTTAMNTRK